MIKVFLLREKCAFHIYGIDYDLEIPQSDIIHDLLHARTELS